MLGIDFANMIPVEAVVVPASTHFFTDLDPQLTAVSGAVAKFTLNRAHQMVTA